MVLKITLQFAMMMIQLVHL